MSKALFTAILFACLGAQPASSYVLTEVLPAETILPLVELDKGQVATCGFVASAVFNTERFEVRSGVKRNPPGTTFFFEINRFSADGSLVHPGGIQTWLPFSKQSHDEAKVAPFSGIAPVTSDKAAQDIQNFMLRGFRAIIITTLKDAKPGEGYSFERDGQRIEIELKGPLPQNVRATYLNCAGDMYRQE